MVLKLLQNFLLERAVALVQSTYLEIALKKYILFTIIVSYLHNTSRSFFTIARFHHNTCCLIIYCNNTFTVQLVLPALQYPHTIHYTSMYLYMCVICPWTRTYTRTHTYIPTHIYCTFSYNIVLVLNCYNIVSYNYLTLLIYVGNNRYLVCT